MEVKGENLGSSLRVMLDLLCKSDFVSMDFEMSGTPEHKQYSTFSPLQIRYDENVVAAKKYAIVQIGITIVIKDEGKGRLSPDTWLMLSLTNQGCYQAYPFNMHLKPSMDETFEIDREVTFKGQCT